MSIYNQQNQVWNMVTVSRTPTKTTLEIPYIKQTNFDLHLKKEQINSKHFWSLFSLFGQRPLYIKAQKNRETRTMFSITSGKKQTKINDYIYLYTIINKLDENQNSSHVPYGNKGTIRLNSIWTYTYARVYESTFKTSLSTIFNSYQSNVPTKNIWEFYQKNC